MKKTRIVIFIIIITLLIVAILSLSDDVMSPYVSFAHAKEHSGSYVQIIGVLDRGTPVKHHEKGLSFTVSDGASRMKIVHDGPRPLNFEHADKIVLLGKYSLDADVFQADKVLVKCPSKYQKEGQ